MTDILALDIATTCGWARGRVGSMPVSGSVRFAAPGASENAVFGQALRWMSETLQPEPRPDLLIFEGLLPPAAMQGETTRQVRDRLAGLHGVVRAVAFLRGVYEIASVSVGDVRMHFIGARSLKREAAKRETIRRCKALGWPVEDDNQADALAVWSFACGLIDPTHAIKLSPLFNRAIAI